MSLFNFKSNNSTIYLNVGSFNLVTDHQSFFITDRNDGYYEVKREEYYKIKKEFKDDILEFKYKKDSKGIKFIKNHLNKT